MIYQLLVRNSCPPKHVFQKLFALLGRVNIDWSICYAAEEVESLKPNSIVIDYSGSCRVSKDLKQHLNLQMNNLKLHLRNFHSCFQISKGYDNANYDVKY